MIHEQELHPGANCPQCGEPIVTWWTEQREDPDENVPDDKCWLPTDDVKPAYPVQMFKGNIIIIEHNAPTLDG